MRSKGLHYENLPMQCTEIFSAVKIENFIRKIPMKNFDIFIFAQNIDCGYTLEPSRQGGSNTVSPRRF